MTPPLLLLILLAFFGFASEAEAKPRQSRPALDLATINDAGPDSGRRRGLDPLAVKAAVLLDRARFSPGVVDGAWGDNLRRATESFQSAQGLMASGRIDADTWAKLNATSAEPAVMDYEISPSDLIGPFLPKLPAKLELMRDLKSLSFTSAREFLAEKFHMSEGLLQALNLGEDFRRSGRKIIVANVAAGRSDDKQSGAARLEVRKAQRRLVVLDLQGGLVASYPASVGSAEKPAPTGTFEVRRAVENPTYTYNPDYKFRGVTSKTKFDIAGGPNNPVGAVWIDLSAPSYGIHGTPEPDRIGKSYSHGCIRLTNWDARAVMAMVKKGTPVDFKD